MKHKDEIINRFNLCNTSRLKMDLFNVNQAIKINTELLLKPSVISTVAINTKAERDNRDNFDLAISPTIIKVVITLNLDKRLIPELLEYLSIVISSKYSLTELLITASVRDIR